MGFSFYLGKTDNDVKLKRKYIKEIANEKEILNSQLKRLDSQLKDNIIDQYIYERLKRVLEIHSARAHFIKQREEVIEKVFGKK